MNEPNEFAEFGLYLWVPKRAVSKLNSAFKEISTAVSKEVGWTRNLLFETCQYEDPP